jgi:hypothetical protein
MVIKKARIHAVAEKSMMTHTIWRGRLIFSSRAIILEGKIVRRNTVQI